MLCCVFGTLWPVPRISQHRTLLSHDPAIRNDVVLTLGGENLKQDIESSGGLVTSKSFIGLGWLPRPRLIPPVVLLPKLEVPKELPPNMSIVVFKKSAKFLHHTFESSQHK